MEFDLEAGDRNIKKRSLETTKNKLVQGFSQYCQETSLHGWQYVQLEKRILLKLMWFFVILLYYVTATIFICKNFHEYNNGATIVTIKSTTASLDEVTFPSLYVCNLNQFTRSFLANIGVNEVDEEYTMKLLHRELISGSQTRMTPDEQDYLAKIQEKMAKDYDYHDQSHNFDISNQDCSDMLMKVRWSKKTVKMFYSAVRRSTDYGMCCVTLQTWTLVKITLLKCSTLEIKSTTSQEDLPKTE